MYAETAAAIAERAPACWASGRCCNFERSGHLLYVTGLEAAYAVLRINDSSVQKPVDPAAGVVSGRERSLAQLGTSPDSPASAVTLKTLLGAAPERPGCPFQAANLCSVHSVKPLACRTYFCDRTALEWQGELSERMHARIRAVHDEWAVEYRYSEWRDLLARFGAAMPG